MDFLRASLWTLYGLPHGLFYGLSTGFSTDTLRASPRFFPRARTEAGEWRRKPHVKVPSPRTAARRLSPRTFHGRGRLAARSPLGARQGRDAGNASCPKPSAAFSLKLAWRQTAPLPEHRFATRYRSGDMRSVSRLWRASRPLRGLPPCGARRTAVGCNCRVGVARAAEFLV